MTRSRACTDRYVRRWSTRACGSIGRAVSPRRSSAIATGLIAQAGSERIKDSADEVIAERCRAIVAHLTPEAQADVSSAQRCVAQADRGAFVACVMPIV